MSNKGVCRSVGDMHQNREAHGRGSLGGGERGGRRRRGNRGYNDNNPQRHRFHAARQPTPVLRSPGEYTAGENVDCVKARNRSRFSNAGDAGAKTPSSKRASPAQRRKNKGQRVQNIGIGRATGVSRVPDSKLSTSASLVREQLKELADRMEGLLQEKRTMIGQAEAGKALPLAEESLDEWETIQGRFRKLTMSITASSRSDVKALAIPVYERAAEAYLYSGNLSYYLSCQTRLLRELYTELDAEIRNESSRYSEFVGYSLLYFGVFRADKLEVAQIMRGMDPETRRTPSVKLALSIISALQNRNAWRVLARYRQLDERQRVLLFPRLDDLRREALTTLIRSYMALSKTMAVSIVGMNDESEFLALLLSERSDLAAQVDEQCDEYSFRVPARK